MRESRSDDELLAATARGERGAFEQFYRRNAPWLQIRLRRRCGDPDLAEEVVQETFIAVWRAASSYRGPDRSGPWLWTIATNRLVDAHRRRAARARTVSEPSDDLAVTRSAEDDALVSTYDANLASALDRLSPELREILQATVLDGLSVRETAVLLNIPEGTVKSRADRARRQLREALA